MKIGSLARRAGVGVETVRFYERKGLVEQPAKPRDGGFRTYPRDAVQRIRFIRQAQELGFSLRETGELLALKAIASSNCADVRDRARSKLEDVHRKIDQLDRIKGALEQLIDACPGEGALRSCSIIEFLDSTESDEAPCDHRA